MVEDPTLKVRTHKQAIVLRTDLKMPAGKLVSQGAHASLAAALSRGTRVGDELRIPLDADLGPWLSNSFTKICLAVSGEAALVELHAKATELGLPCSLIKDSGLTVFNGIPTHTAVAIGPGLLKLVDEITGHLPLLKK